MLRSVKHVLTAVCTACSPYFVSASNSSNDTDVTFEVAGDSDMLPVIIALSVGVPVLLIAGLVIAYFVIRRRKTNVERLLRTVQELDEAEQDFETRQDTVKHEIELYVSKLELCVSQSAPPSQKHETLMSAWKTLLEDSNRFVEQEYTPALNIRRASAEAAQRGLPSVTRQVSEGHITVPKVQQVQRSEGVLPRKLPATPLAEVSRQLATLREFELRLDAISRDLQSLRAELPVLGCGAVGTTPASSLPNGVGGAAQICSAGQLAGSNTGSGAEHWHHGHHQPQHNHPNWQGHGRHRPRRSPLDDEAEVLRAFLHPLLARVTVKPYGVLGSAWGDRDPQPGSHINSIVVDPAGWPYIGRMNNPRGAGGAAGSIYKWLNIVQGANSKFPEIVHSHFTAAYEAEAETKAKFHVYGTGQYVIHAIGPKVSRVLEGVTDLSHTYLNILCEFCQATSRKDFKVPKVLRLLPISSGIFLQNRRLESHMAQITSAAMSLAFAMMPLSMHDQLRSADIELCIFQPHEQQAYEQAFQEKRLLAAHPLVLTEELGCLPQRFGSYDWVRQKNAPRDRLERLGTILLTQRATCGGGYALPRAAGSVQLDLTALREGTQVLHSPETLHVDAPGKLGQGAKTQVVWQERATVMEAAIDACRDKTRVVAVNAASAFHVGGGVLTGGRHACEESWCTMSTLLHSLQEIQWKDVISRWGNDGSQGGGIGKALRDATSANKVELQPPSTSPAHGAMHVPVDGCIVSPGIDIFREVSGKGYAFNAQVTQLAGVCSVAMFNMNPRVSDSPVDAPRDFDEYCSQVKQKFRSVVAGALGLHAEVLVCPDVGCGVFQNDPHILGTLFGEVLCEKPGALPSVILTGRADFASAVKAVVASVGATRQPLEKPAYFENTRLEDSRSTNPVPEAWQNTQATPDAATSQPDQKNTGKSKFFSAMCCGGCAARQAVIDPAAQNSRLGKSARVSPDAKTTKPAMPSTKAKTPEAASADGAGVALQAAETADAVAKSAPPRSRVSEDMGRGAAVLQVPAAPKAATRSASPASTPPGVVSKAGAASHRPTSSPRPASSPPPTSAAGVASQGAASQVLVAPKAAGLSASPRPTSPAPAGHDAIATQIPAVPKVSIQSAAPQSQGLEIVGHGMQAASPPTSTI